VIPKSLTPLLALILLFTSLPLEAADPAAAERQFRIARRLVAEGSAEARAALEKVIELDPAGALADDATVEKALLLGIPLWPEDLGKIEIRPAQEALGLVGWVSKEMSGSDRALEARYLRALLLLEPLPFHDASEARLDLITVATAGERTLWSRAARYATGWLAEQQGKGDRALAAYQRLVVDAPASEAASRAEVGLARLMLRLGRPGDAARHAQQAVDAGAPPETGAEGLREQAVRALLGHLPGAGGGAAGPPSATQGVVRSQACFAAAPDGGLLLGDQKNDAVILLDRSGGIKARWELDDIQAVAISPAGRPFAAAGESIYRLNEGRPPLRIASQGELAPASALATDCMGRLFLLGRKGDRLGRIEPGAAAPVEYAAEGRLAAIAWNGIGLIGVDARERVLVVIGPEGSRRTLPASGLQKPVDIAADAAGGIAVLDSRAGAVLLYDAEGSRIGSVTLDRAGMSRASAVDIAHDGAVCLLDASGTAYVRVP
jgi:hypothetical protein